MSVPVSGSRAFSTAWAAFWCRRCLGLAWGEAKVSSRKVTPTPSVPPTSRKRRRGPRLPLDHLGEQRQPHRDDLAVLGQPGDGLVQEGVLVPGQIADALGQVPVGLPNAVSTLRAWRGSKRSTSGDVLALDQVDLQVAHEPAGGQPEVVPHQDDRLDVLAVALPQGGDQLGVLLAPPGVQPLLELVEDEQHLLARAAAPAPAARAARDSTRPSSGGRSGQTFRSAFEQPGLGLLRGRLDVDRQDVLGQPGQQARLDQRRLAAARGTVDQADPEGLVRVGRLDPGLPEPDALGQAVAVARAGQQLQEEVGVVLVERPQSLGDDLDRSVDRSRIARRSQAEGVTSGSSRVAGRRSRSRLGDDRACAVWRKCRRSSARSRAVRVPLRRPLRQRLQADPLQLPGDRVVDLPGRAGLGRWRSGPGARHASRPRNGRRPVSSS